MVRIQDIAEKVGMSVSTVSRALSGSSVISRDASEKIEKVAVEMGYQKRSIRRHKSRAILNIKVLLPQHTDPERLLFFNLNELLEGLAQGLAPCAFNFICPNVNPEEELFPHKKGGHVDAVIFAFCEPWVEVLQELREVGCAYYVLNRAIPGVPCIRFDDESGMEKIVAHLARDAEGLKPAYIALSGFDEARRARLNSLARACGRYDVPFSEEDDGYVFSSSDEVTAQSLSEIRGEYNAFICMNDITAHLVQSSLLELGVRIPEEVQVTGFDDSPMRNLTRPLLTTVSLQVLELGKRAGQELQKQIIEKSPPEMLISIDGPLKLGQSTL